MRGEVAKNPPMQTSAWFQGKYLGTESLGSTVSVYLTLWETANEFSKATCRAPPPPRVWGWLFRVQGDTWCVGASRWSCWGAAVRCRGDSHRRACHSVTMSQCQCAFLDGLLCVLLCELPSSSGPIFKWGVCHFVTDLRAFLM